MSDITFQQNIARSTTRLRYLRVPRASELRVAALLVLTVALLVWMTPRAADQIFDGPLHLAEQMLNGRTYFTENVTWWEGYTRDGRFYLAYAPMCSAVLVPYIALGGSGLGQGVANTLFILGATVLLWKVMRAQRCLRRWADVAALAYLLGTPLLYSVAKGTVWLLIHSEGNFFLLAALWFLCRRRYGWAGLFFATAICCRNALIFSAPMLLVILWRGRPTAANGRRYAMRIARMALGALPPVLLMLCLHWCMTGNPFVTTYHMTYAEWHEDKQLYDPQNFWNNLQFYAFAAPKRIPSWPYLKFELGGQAFWMVSPFFLLLLLGIRLRTRLLRAAVVGAVCGFVPYLLFKWNGFEQYGSRYVTDIFPYLVPLTFSGLSRFRTDGRRAVVGGLAIVLVVAAIGLNVLVACLTHLDKLPT